MRILVTGGAGFIGSHLVEHLLDQGHHVHVVDDLSTGLLSNLAAVAAHPRFRFDKADLIDWNGLWAAAQRADRIYHLAAVVGVKRVLADPVRVMTTNIACTERVFRAASAGDRRPRVIYASTSEVYGFNPNGAMQENDDLHYRAGSRNRWSYAIAKLAGEHFADAYGREKGLQTVVLRLFNTIGPRQRDEYGMVVPNFVRQALAGIPITVHGDGQQTRSFCDVRDTVRLIAQLAETDEAVGEPVNVGNDREITIQALAELVRDRAGGWSGIRHVSCAEAYGEDFDDVRRRRPDLTRVKQLTGFTHRWTLTDTIDDLIRREVESAPPLQVQPMAAAAE
jgi:UDP-glucose 4-epimerase